MYLKNEDGFFLLGIDRQMHNAGVLRVTRASPMSTRIVRVFARKCAAPQRKGRERILTTRTGVLNVSCTARVTALSFHLHAKHRTRENADMRQDAAPGLLIIKLGGFLLDIYTPWIYSTPH